MINRLGSITLWFVFFASGLVVAVWLAWIALASLDFGFSLGYRLLGIEQHIQIYGPQNRYRQHFGETTYTEHLRLFSEIVDAIHAGGDGLAEISYTLPDGTQATLMREPEVIHLQDVANLIDSFYWIAAFCLAAWLASCIAIYRKKLRLPGWRATGLGLIGFVISGLVVVFAVGPKQLFYWLHIQLFPPEHEWFFYYQDSLMTTVMKAPDIFGFISTLIGLLALVIYAATLWGTQRILRDNQTR